MSLEALLLLLLTCFSCVPFCVTPQTAAHQAPPSLGFSRQEHWSGLPFPSPMQESEKWKWSRSVVSNSSRPHGLQPTRLLRPWDFPGKSTGVGCYRLLHTRSSNPSQSRMFAAVLCDGSVRQADQLRSHPWEDLSVRQYKEVVWMALHPLPRPVVQDQLWKDSK